ncbi:cytochrome c [Psychrobacter frigidicola]|uniref:Cytochrome c n=1 Tax=Psychrobacter frigidicola TaxID=45611 RepID=A0A5C7A5N3_9GAMM|nr:cytochrome c [Psychrobacter frigidicola]TXD98582.1 cytochrome c [Psychrobacter frigidicola]
MENIKPKALAMVLLSASVIAVLSGCSQRAGDDVETVGSKQAAVQPTDTQESRNAGAWGGVYMSRDELAAPKTNIVNVSSLPTVANDPSLVKWQAKFEGTEVKTREGSANAQTVFESTNGFVTTDGEKLYHDSCAGCHMHKGEGAIGAGYYPPLANNSKMESKYYVIDILINGFRGMPSFHTMMNDEQMAAVTQYVHSELNGFKDTVTAADVAQLRHANPPGADPSE